MDEAVSIAHPFLVLAWFGALGLLFAGFAWIDLYKKMVRLRSRGGGTGIDLDRLQDAAFFTGLGLVGVVVGLGLHFLL
ncbi:MULTISPECIES: hypothetical protein [unclassified Sphingomonas]|uniref:hypothetical protein n=1 Tax=unclassified Sphingomonas TaxID=196159 RepID=UPI0006F321F8|nr:MULTISPECIES: hypothetical protein [unclassified Sphingomonas]KQM64695.1 hypothetical protein ASE65_15610 [Sphingomonas sp. Leaf16]KQN16827.1 hypothetical protein ASE81_15660 [Sphingomonas sp. Leaf29]KQN22810.1 hypothetical protein ASE83_15590 [Sphingomonas sp. Leaf32]